MEFVVWVVNTTEGADVWVGEFFVAVDVPVHGLPGAAGVGVSAPGPGLDNGELEVSRLGGRAAGFEAVELDVDSGGFELGSGVERDCCCRAEEEYEGN